MLYFPEVKTKNALVENCVILGQGKRFFFFQVSEKGLASPSGSDGYHCFQGRSWEMGGNQGGPTRMGLLKPPQN